MRTDIETKAGAIRRVRTPAGVRRFKQPIGSIILRDRKLTHMRLADSPWEGWEVVEQLDKQGRPTGKFYSLGRDEDINKWIATDASKPDDWTPVVEADSEEELYDLLNQSFGGEGKRAPTKSGPRSGRPGKGVREDIGQELGGWANQLNDDGSPLHAEFQQIVDNYDDGTPGATLDERATRALLRLLKEDNPDMGPDDELAFGEAIAVLTDRGKLPRRATLEEDLAYLDEHYPGHERAARQTEGGKLATAMRRQEAIDQARSRASFLAEMEEALLNDTDADAMTRMMHASVKKNKLTSDPVAGGIAIAIGKGDSHAVLRAIRAAASKHGFRRMAATNAEKYDPKKHDVAGGGKLKAGAAVQTVRPGYEFTHEGESITLFKPVVEEDDVPKRTGTPLSRLIESLRGDEELGAELRQLDYQRLRGLMTNEDYAGELMTIAGRYKNDGDLQSRIILAAQYLDPRIEYDPEDEIEKARRAAAARRIESGIRGGVVSTGRGSGGVRMRDGGGRRGEKYNDAPHEGELVDISVLSGASTDTGYIVYHGGTRNTVGRLEWNGEAYEVTLADNTSVGTVDTLQQGKKLLFVEHNRRVGGKETELDDVYAIDLDPIPGVTEVESDYEGWRQFEDEEGYTIYFGQDPNDQRWYATGPGEWDEIWGIGDTPEEAWADLATYYGPEEEEPEPEPEPPTPPKKNTVPKATTTGAAGKKLDVLRDNLTAGEGIPAEHSARYIQMRTMLDKGEVTNAQAGDIFERYGEELTEQGNPRVGSIYTRLGQQLARSDRPLPNGVEDMANEARGRGWIPQYLHGEDSEGRNTVSLGLLNPATKDFYRIDWVSGPFGELNITGGSATVGGKTRKLSKNEAFGQAVRAISSGSGGAEPGGGNNNRAKAVARVQPYADVLGAALAVDRGATMAQLRNAVKPHTAKLSDDDKKAVDAALKLKTPQEAVERLKLYGLGIGLRNEGQAVKFRHGTEDIEVVAAKKPVAPPTPEPPKPSGPVYSKNPILRNTWGGENTTGIHFHPDGAIGIAIGRLGKDASLEVEGDALANVLGKAATEVAAGRLTPQQAVDRIKQIGQQLEPGSRARETVIEAADALDAPDFELKIPQGTPTAIRELARALHQMPIARRETRSGKPKVLEVLQEIMDQYADGTINNRGLRNAVSQRLHNSRHESEEGKIEMDRVIRTAMDAIAIGKTFERDESPAEVITLKPAGGSNNDAIATRWRSVRVANAEGKLRALGPAYAPVAKRVAAIREDLAEGRITVADAIRGLRALRDGSSANVDKALNQAIAELEGEVPKFKDIWSDMLLETKGLSAAEAKKTGAMIALVPRQSDIDRLHLEGGEPKDQLHLTLMFLGKGADYNQTDRTVIIGKMRELAEYMYSIEGRGFSINYFNPKGEEPCVVMGVGGNRLESIHRDTLSCIQDWNLGFWNKIPEQHSPWIPHITLAYEKNGKPLPDVSTLSGRTGPVVFDRIRVVFEGEETDIPLIMSNEEITRVLHGILAQGKSILGDEYKLVRTPGGRLGDPSSRDRSPRENWVDRAGGMPKYIRMVRNALMREGHPIGKATAMAVNAIKRWAKGGDNVTPKVQAAAAKALAEWEKMKAGKSMLRAFTLAYNGKEG